MFIDAPEQNLCHIKYMYRIESCGTFKKSAVVHTLQVQCYTFVTGARSWGRRHCIKCVLFGLQTVHVEADS